MRYGTHLRKPQRFSLKRLGIPSGKAHVPAMVWKATKEQLYVYAIKEKRRPDEQTKLFDAPYFNLHEDGMVCMGTVQVEFEEDCCLEDFIERWEQYFWNSKFSHLIHHYSPVTGNIVQLWQGLIGQDKPFPIELLKKNDLILKDIIV
jgi:PRTRC genetic system protein B